ncbi:uncharacterized protein M6B38_295015 [Iris pallida]|uniref:BSD domain-containing protein n=1 Tax=Iris pallida TaxID=29817 RepID=A0AAX6HS60_IRIPA|nr:uncharacterized protein M6B38_295015 [Iris pallida]
MSWFAKSLVNTFRGEEDDDDDEHRHHRRDAAAATPHEEEEEEAIVGVKEDLSELTQTLTRQFWGVASFLAPPPPPAPLSVPADPDLRRDPADVGSPRLDGIRSDLAEIGGRFRSGISLLSNAKAVSEISKIASTFLPFGSEAEEEEEEEGGEAVGVTEEVVAFARSVSMHPETWLDFPLSPDDDDNGSEAFEMSDAQQEHALAVESLAPSLAALRIELCPSHMSENHFWKIYFVLLHSRLNEHDAELLSTPQIVQARAMLLQDSSRTKPDSEGSGRGVSPSYKKEGFSGLHEVNVVSPLDTPSETLPSKNETHEESATSVPITVQTLPSKAETQEESATSVPITDLETEKHPVQATEVKIIDKSVIEENPPVHAETKDIHSDASTVIPIQKYEEEDGEADDWLEEDTGEAGGPGGGTVPLDNDEDVSFSDLEDDEDKR